MKKYFSIKRTHYTKITRQVAKTLYVEYGIKSKVIADYLHISQDTLTDWVKKYGWLAIQKDKKPEGSVWHKMQLAKNFYVDAGFTLKQISKIIVVSENTLGKWCKSGNWKMLSEMPLNERLKQFEYHNKPDA